jgi:hypothetical protein
MTTKEAIDLCQGELKDVVLNILMELGTDDDALSLAEGIEEFFLGNYNILYQDNGYPDFEEVAIEFISNM